MGQSAQNLRVQYAAPTRANSRKRPLLITFSGIDGCGKSTNIATLTSWLTGAGLRVRAAAFWDDVVVFPGLRQRLTHRLFHGETGVGAPERPVQRRDKNLHPWYVSAGRCVFFLLDAIHLRWLATRMLRSEADVIIFDRYLYDQLAILPIRQKAVRIYARLLCKLVPRPDIAYLLDADPEAAFLRKPEYPLEFMKHYRRSYFLVSELVREIQVIPAVSLDEAARSVADEFRRVGICPPDHVPENVPEHTDDLQRA
jgi:thymidylate kinase